jgi:hypothetical protein
MIRFVLILGKGPAVYLSIQNSSAGSVSGDELRTLWLHELETGTAPCQLSASNLWLLQIHMAQAFGRKIDHHRMETAVKPEKNGLQAPFAKPTDATPTAAVQLLLESSIANLCRYSAPPHRFPTLATGIHSDRPVAEGH